MSLKYEPASQEASRSDQSKLPGVNLWGFQRPTDVTNAAKVWGVRCTVYGVRCRVWGVGGLGAGVRSSPSASDPNPLSSSLGFWVSGFGFQVSGFGLRVWGFGRQPLGFPARPGRLQRCQGSICLGPYGVPRGGGVFL
jgi:hypothetical protein